MKDLLSIATSRTNGASSAELEFLEEKEKDIVYLMKRLDALKTSVDDQCVQVIPPQRSTSTTSLPAIDKKSSRTCPNQADVYVDIHRYNLGSVLICYGEISYRG